MVGTGARLVAHRGALADLNGDHTQETTATTFCIESFDSSADCADGDAMLTTIAKRVKGHNLRPAHATRGGSLSCRCGGQRAPDLPNH